jgi:hypothetical protein
MTSLIFSRTLGEHLLNLQRVIERVVEVGLKLKPSKCKFVQKELEYLGHIVSREGLKPNPHLVEAVQELPGPKTVQGSSRGSAPTGCSYPASPKLFTHFITCKDADFT